MGTPDPPRRGIEIPLPPSLTLPARFTGYKPVLLVHRLQTCATGLQAASGLALEIGSIYLYMT